MRSLKSVCGWWVYRQDILKLCCLYHSRYITWNLIRNANSWYPSQKYWMVNSDVRSWQTHFAKLSRWLWYTLKTENHWFQAFIVTLCQRDAGWMLSGWGWGGWEVIFLHCHFLNNALKSRQMKRQIHSCTHISKFIKLNMLLSCITMYSSCMSAISQ